MLKSIIFASLLLPSLALADVNEALQNICKIVEADDKAELRKKMKAVKSDYRLKLADYYDAISCGGSSLIQTAIINNSVEAGTLLIKKLPRKVLKEKGLIAWAVVEGYEDSTIIDVLTKRM